MKMTNGERESFFALYWKQKVAKHGNQPEAVDVICPLYSIDYLELRTVEMLDRQELEHLCELIWDTKIDKNLGYEIYIKDLLHPGSSGYFTRQKVTDYLRSIGVLVGFRHFTPEMLIAEGVVKLKQV